MKAVPLSEVCRIVNGGTPKSGIADYWAGDVAWLTPAEMGKLKSPFIGQTARTITQAGLKNSSARQVPVGAVIMSTRAPIGHLAIPEVPMAFNQGCRGLVPNERLDTKYLYYFLFFSREALNELGTGATFKELASSALGKFHIPLPPLEEQRRIVAVLDEAFAAIATATAKAEKNLVNARELRQSGLDCLWVDVSNVADQTILADWLELVTYGFTNPMPTADAGPYMITAKNVRGGVIDYNNARSTTQDAFDRLLTDKSRPVVGDVLLTKDGTLGRVAVVDRDGICINQSVALLRPKGTLLPYFLSFMLMTSDYQKRMMADAGGTTIKHIYITRVDKMSVKIPDLAKQESAVSAVRKLMRECDVLEANALRKIVAIERLRQTIMSKAFAGELTAAMPETIAA